MPVKSLFRLTFMSFWHISFLSFEHSLYSLAQDVSDLSYTFPVPSLESAISPRSHACFQYGTVFRNQGLHTKYSCCFWAVIVSLENSTSGFYSESSSWFLWSMTQGSSLPSPTPTFYLPLLHWEHWLLTKSTCLLICSILQHTQTSFGIATPHGTMRTNLQRLPGLLATPFVPPSN